MRKTKKLISVVGQAYADEIKRQFPESQPEVVLDAFDGFDVWVRIQAPAKLHERIRAAKSPLFGRFADETGVLVVSTEHEYDREEASTPSRA